MATAEMQGLEGRIEALELALEKERRDHISNLREIATASGLREAHAISLMASLNRDGEQHPHGGPGMSPTDLDSRKPPQGAEHPSASKLDRWMSRSKQQSQDNSKYSNSTSEANSESPVPSKLDRWLSRSATPPIQQPQSKLERWLARSQGSRETLADQKGWSDSQSSEPDQASGDSKALDELMSRIRESWTAVDSALSMLQVDRSSYESVVSGKGESVLCHRCQASAEDAPPGAKRNGKDWASGQGSRIEGTKMGIRMEEKGRGLTVTHVVPGGEGDQAGIQVSDVIRGLNGRPVKSLKNFGLQVKDSGEVVCLEVIRGAGAKHRQLTIYSRTRPASTDDEKDEGTASGSGGEGEAEGGTEAKTEQDVLLEKFLKARRTERDQEKEVNAETRKNDKVLVRSGSPNANGNSKPPNSNKTFNKYGKDTKLWVPESDEAVVELPGDRPGKTEIGGFFMFPPGHPDHVPLPPGEAALIAGRSDVHPMERLAPHWSHIIFVSPSGAEIRAQARHATYGTIEDVSGKMVHADPLTAHSELLNADTVKGSVAYIKRGGAPFTKKARVAVAAGAVACVVANTDRETFGMSYTDDGLPFAALNIPCVMISSDIVSKLEASDEWSVTLVPAKPEQQGTKRPPPPVPRGAREGKGQPAEPSSPPASAGGAQQPHPLQGLETLPINPKGANLGKPGKKPTMWKKIKLMLP